MLKIRRPLGRLIFNMGIAIPGKTVFLIETAPWFIRSLVFPTSIIYNFIRPTFGDHKVFVKRFPTALEENVAIKKFSVKTQNLHWDFHNHNFQIQWKFYFIVIPFFTMISLQIFAHLLTAQLSCHVLKFVEISSLKVGWDQKWNFHWSWIT